jgi:hypothetical protein
MSKKDPTVKEVIATMSLEEREAIYDIFSCIRSKSDHYSAALTIKNMPEEKQMAAYWLIGNVVLAKKKADEAIAEVKELLKV